MGGGSLRMSGLLVNGTNGTLRKEKGEQVAPGAAQYWVLRRFVLPERREKWSTSTGKPSIANALEPSGR
jgi:hypothetical protein